MKLTIFSFVFVFLFSFHSKADSWERTADLRTTAPELITNDKETWGFDLDAGADFVTGNSNSVSANGGLTLYKKWKNWLSYFKANAYYLAVGDPLDDVHNIGNIILRGDYYVSDVFRIFVFTTHGYSEFANIDYRGSLGVGPWIQTNSGRIKNGVSLAYVYEFENFTFGPTERTSRLSLRDVFELSLSEISSLGFDFFYAPSLQDFNDFRIRFGPYIRVGIVKDRLSLKVSALFERDNRPALGVKKNDLGVINSITFHLGPDS